MAETTPLLENGTPVQITSDVYVLEPSQAATGDLDVNTNAPQLILIFGWMDAPLAPLKKYMTMYNALFPRAVQVLVKSKQAVTWMNRRKNLNTVRPIVDIMQKNGFFSLKPPNLLIHVFSNGGSMQLQLLSELLQEEYPIPVESIPPVTCFVFDSLPGDTRLGPALEAHTASIKSPLLKYLAYLPLTLLWLTVMGSSYILGKPNPITTIREGLNQATVLPWTNKHTPRVYIYSRDDRIVSSTAVEEHIASGRERGLCISAEVFNGSSHVSHLKKDPPRYKDAVSRTWTKALQAYGSSE